MNRREYLLRCASALALPLSRVERALAGADVPRLAAETPSDYPFSLGIASGDPTPTGIVLWTRLAPDPLNGGGMPPQDLELAWEVASDGAFDKVVQSGFASAPAQYAHSVHVEVEDLEPNRWYWYRFHYGSAVSPTGRTRTAPAAGAPVERLNFGFVSCQNYQGGWFTAYRHLAREPLDLVVHLGDYIYENGLNDNPVRPHQDFEAVSLEQYRNRYALYKLDPDLQAAHASFPWIVTWDDHEVDNDYAGAISQNEDPVAEFLQRRANAYQAYYEHQPLRRSSIPNGPDMQLYRYLGWGRLAGFWVLDTRQYRSDQPCNPRNPQCTEPVPEDQTMLGAAQEQWLFEGLSQSQCQWNILAQQVIMARIDFAPGEDQPRYVMDHWSGYEVSRDRLFALLEEGSVSNPVVITGDAHANWAIDLKRDFDDPASPTIATEFVGTSISSGGDGDDPNPVLQPIEDAFEYVKFVNYKRGYVKCSVTTNEMRTDFRIVDYVERPGSPIRTRATMIVRNGIPGADRDFDNDGIPNEHDADVDGDRIPNYHEQLNGLDPLNAADAGLDEDGDGLTNLEAFRQRSLAPTVKAVVDLLLLK